MFDNIHSSSTRDRFWETTFFFLGWSVRCFIKKMLHSLYVQKIRLKSIGFEVGTKCNFVHTYFNYCFYIEGN